MNKVLLTGNLTAEPKYGEVGADARPVCRFRIATNEGYTDSNGQRQELTEFHNIVVWGKRAKACANHLQKGQRVEIEGKMTTREWDDDRYKDEDGKPVRRYFTQVRASDVTFREKSKKQQAQQAATDEANTEEYTLKGGDEEMAVIVSKLSGLSEEERTQVLSNLASKALDASSDDDAVETSEEHEQNVQFG